jgi:hypothetical protein
MIKNNGDIDKFEKIEAQLRALHEEIGMLSKKKPDDGINQFKLRLVNDILEKANELLGSEYKPFPDFKIFDLESVPTNSDVVMILAQYMNCMEKLRSDNIVLKSFNDWRWIVKRETTEIKTSPPRKLQER